MYCVCNVDKPEQKNKSEDFVESSRDLFLHGGLLSCDSVSTVFSDEFTPVSFLME